MNKRWMSLIIRMVQISLHPKFSNASSFQERISFDFFLWEFIRATSYRKETFWNINMWVHEGLPQVSLTKKAVDLACRNGPFKISPATNDSCGTECLLYCSALVLGQHRNQSNCSIALTYSPASLRLSLLLRKRAFFSERRLELSKTLLRTKFTLISRNLNRSLNFVANLLSYLSHWLRFQQHQFNANLSLRGVALILDKNWNNAYLIPPSHKVGDRHYSLCTHFELSEQGHVLLSMRPTNSRRDTKEWISSVSPTIGNVRSRKWWVFNG